VRLRDVRRDDLQLYERLRCDPAMTVELGGPQPPEEIEPKLRLDVADVEADRSWISVIESDEGDAMGTVCIWSHGSTDGAVSEIGWMVLPEFQGSGVGGWAAAAILERARADGRWGEIHAYPSVTNEPSNRICRSLGFDLVGEEEFEYRGHMLHGNHWRLDPGDPAERTWSGPMHER
jgi:RimJ/RimL family protein N-acetyltransferase